MHHQHRSVSKKLDNKVTITYCIKTVLIDPVKIQLLRHKMTIDRECSSCQRSSAQRKNIDPFVAVLKTFDITPEHRHIRHQMMRKKNRLRTLQMCVSRKDRRQICLSLSNQRFLQIMQQSYKLHYPFTQIQVHIRCHLIVAAAPSMQLPANRSNLIDQIFFDIHVNILV
ncbi:hypothetical protein D3C76_474570 [compost metagenome]